MASDYHYPGEELELFRHAWKWKQYVGDKLRPYIRGDVLEVGAGIGETAKYLVSDATDHWTFVEPDKRLMERLESNIRHANLPVPYTTVCGYMTDLRAQLSFDTILYIDVLEHIKDDRSELLKTVSYLRTEGRLIVLGPAHQSLYSEFDRALGHYRRYSKRSLRNAAPDLFEEKIFYLDSASILLLWLNKYLLKKPRPTKWDIQIWQSVFLSMSKALDKILSYRTGKSIVAIWRKT